MEERTSVYSSVFKDINAELSPYLDLEKWGMEEGEGTCALSVAVTGRQVDVANLGDR